MDPSAERYHLILHFWAANQHAHGEGDYWWKGVVELLLTCKIQVFEQLPILVVPSLAHVHAEGPVQVRDILWSFLHEIVRFHPGQLLPLLLLCLQALFVNASPLPLLLDEVPGASVWIWGSSAIGMLGTLSKSQLRKRMSRRSSGASISFAIARPIARGVRVEIL